MAITTDIDYPEGLPFPIREGYAINHVQPFRRTKLASGRAIQRKTFKSVPSIVDVSWIFTGSSEAAAFEAWFSEKLNDGVEWFNGKLKTPIGEGNYVCRFVEMYKGPLPFGICGWKISATLEIWERPLLPSGWGLLPEYAIYADIFDIAMNFEWPEA